MKNKIILFLIIIQFSLLTNLALAQNEESTPSAETGSDKVSTETIENFKEKIASKVAELTKKEQKALAGFVSKIEDSQLTIKSDEQQNYQIKIDNIFTKIYQIAGNGKKEIKLDQLAKDDYLIVNGPINDNTISANYIFVDEKYIVNVGRVTEIDKDNYSVKLLTADKETINLDIETSTKQSILNIKTLQLERTGFSKIKEGDLIHFIIKKDSSAKNGTRFSAVKILIIPQEYFIK